MFPKTCGYCLLFFLYAMIQNCQGMQNGATELSDVIQTALLQNTPNNVTLNQARRGGRRTDSKAQTAQSQLGCRELRSTRYISDGQCTSVKAVKELVCAGECVPAHLLPNWIGGGYWARRGVPEWRCTNDSTRTQRVKLRCRDGSTRTYKVTAVTSCTCKRYTRELNESALQRPVHKIRPKKRDQKKSKD